MLHYIIEILALTQSTPPTQRALDLKCFDGSGIRSILVYVDHPRMVRKLDLHEFAKVSPSAGSRDNRL